MRMLYDSYISQNMRQRTSIKKIRMDMQQYYSQELNKNQKH